MKRLALSCILALLTIAPVLGAQTWPLSRVNQSVAMLTWIADEGNCTAFSINQSKGTYVTAAHCADGTREVFINGEPAELIIANYVDDVAVYALTGKGQPALQLGPRPAPGTEVMAVGHGRGAPIPLAVTGIVIGEIVSPFGDAVNLQFQSAQPIPGMSGGPVVTRDGKVVGIVQCVMASIGCGSRYDVTSKLIKQYR